MKKSGPKQRLSFVLGGRSLCIAGVLDFSCEASDNTKHTRRTVSGISGHLKLVYPYFFPLDGITSWIGILFPKPEFLLSWTIVRVFTCACANVRCSCC